MKQLILNDEQLAYLKSLESPKKRRKFMLDCLVKNVLGESEKSVKISELPIKEIDEKTIVRLPTYQTSTAPETLKGLLKTCGYSESDNKGVDLPENLYEIKDSAIILDNVENYDIRQFGHLFIRINGNFHSAYVRTIGNNLKIYTANKIEDGAYEVFVVEGNKIVPFVKNDQSDKVEPQKSDEEVNFLIEIQNYLEGKELPLEINEVQDLERIFLKYHQSAKPNYSPEEIEIAKSLNSEREEKKEIVKDEKFRRTVDAIKYIKGYLPYFCFESKTASLKVINSAFDYFKDTYFVVEFDIQEGKEKMIQLNCENVPKEAFDEIEKKWTDEDMRNAYLTAIVDWLQSENGRKGFDSETLFKKYLKSLKTK